jgi:hypothetical protein
MNPERFSKLCCVALIIITAAALILTIAYQPDAKAIQAAAEKINMFQY